jgi:DNA-binding transcriptional MerR regulator
MMMILGLSILAVVYILWTPSRPERLLLGNLKRFFQGCGHITGGFALNRIKDRGKGRKLRKRYYESMVLPVPAQLQKVEKNLDYKLFPDNTPDKVKHLIESLQSITFRLQSLEIAHNRVLTHSPDLMKSLNPLRKQLRERLQRVFDRWAHFERADALGDERATLLEISRDLEKKFDTLTFNKDKVRTEDRMLRNVYSLLGTLKGLIEAMADTQEVINQINWDQWAEERF